MIIIIIIIIFAGHIVFIPLIALTKDCHLPFILTTRQFRLKPPYAKTINKPQGQTLTKVGIYLPQSVFTHAQLYAVIFRVTLAIIVCNLHWHRHQRTLWLLQATPIMLTLNQH